MSSQSWPECTRCAAQPDELTPFDGKGFKWVTVDCAHCGNKFESRMRHDALFEMRVPGAHE